MRVPIPFTLLARRSTAGHARGQSLVEFTLVFPIMLLILLTVADFGRYFAAGITVESLARAAAETAAGEVVREPPPLGGAAYARLHRYAWQSVCDEAAGLPNVKYNGPGVQCDNIPTLVCVRDGVDPDCATVYNATGGIPAACSSFATPLTNTANGDGSSVEVRVCYRFSTLLPMEIPFIGGSLSPLSGDFFIERTRAFAVMDY